MLLVNLQSVYPSIQRGLSARSVRRFCNEKGITKLKGNELDEVVEEAVVEVGPRGNPYKVSLYEIHSCFNRLGIHMGEV